MDKNNEEHIKDLENKVDIAIRALDGIRWKVFLYSEEAIEDLCKEALRKLKDA